MARRQRDILILNGHPDRSRTHFCHALTEAYAEGAREAGHRVSLIGIADHDIPFVRSREDWEGKLRPAFVEPAQAAFLKADHIVFVHPLWMGTMPAMLKAFLEQILRPDFAFDTQEAGMRWPRRLKGKSAHVVVTMGMPSIAYRLYYLSHGLKATTRNILGFSGFGPVHNTVIGSVETSGAKRHAAWLEKMRRYGASAY